MIKADVLDLDCRCRDGEYAVKRLGSSRVRDPPPPWDRDPDQDIQIKIFISITPVVHPYDEIWFNIIHEHDRPPRAV